MEINLQIKPLSVNKAWCGKRFKTPEYKQYEKNVLLMLPKREINDFSKVTITFGFSNMMSDIDNGVKLILDILQKKYGVNDRDIVELNLRKVKTKKGEEFMTIVIAD